MMTAAYENPRNVKRVYSSAVFNIKDHKSESFPQVFFCLFTGSCAQGQFEGAL